MFPEIEGAARGTSLTEELRELWAAASKRLRSAGGAAAARRPAEWAEALLPCVGWLRTYRLKEYLLVCSTMGVETPGGRVQVGERPPSAPHAGRQHARRPALAACPFLHARSGTWWRASVWAS